MWLTNPSTIVRGNIKIALFSGLKFGFSAGH
jgi:hypothetical protein